MASRSYLSRDKFVNDKLNVFQTTQLDSFVQAKLATFKTAQVNTLQNPVGDHI